MCTAHETTPGPLAALRAHGSSQGPRAGAAERPLVQMLQHRCCQWGQLMQCWLERCKTCQGQVCCWEHVHMAGTVCAVNCAFLTSAMDALRWCLHSQQHTSGL